jgi:uncharacterized protein
MSASFKPNDTPGSGGDPSMEDILASIRRILSEEEGHAAQPEAPTPPAASDDVLVLESSMMVAEPREAPHQPAPEPASEPASAPAATLVAPEAAAAAASSVGNLLRTLASEQAMKVSSGGPTIEDIVRAELRPLLKEWLDVNLPGLVERLVRAEIERLVGRAVP